ncbi:hypothetical protein WQ54_23905 [Bacillus sp. SA1-12]|uniref:hypothetical protein n=1 Tax=Bacillus sp. SA1-12 TaxID=1455638 RepID=UPI000626F766|nr:hypothetical protein [Bacillus sp. SA1-12]KKI90141.1 hypothetical protein WQ54_23905 [Bacillus sp. SA1-12]
MDYINHLRSMIGHEKMLMLVAGAICDQVSLVKITLISREYNGKLVESNEESMQNTFFSLEELPENIFTEHKIFVETFNNLKIAANY